MNTRFVDGNGAKLWTVAVATGNASKGLPPLLLCNGGPGCCDYLGPVAEMVSDLVEVVRFEQRGCGQSDALPPYDIYSCIADIEAIRQNYGFEQWIVGGHSWGADLALAYSLAYPQRVKGVICISGGRIVNDREWHKIYEQKMAEIGELVPDFDYPPNLEVNEQVGLSWKRYIQRPTLLRELAQFTPPTLFIYGKQDIRPSWPQEQLASLMPNATLELLPDAPHVIWLTHPAELKASLRHFLAEVMALRP